MIEVQNLCRYFGETKAVDNISFNVEKGEVLGFLGPNGAGKSTTMKVITGFISPTSGTVRILGHDIEQDSIEAKKKVGYLAENAPLYGEMKVGEFLAFVADVRGYEGAHKFQAVERVYDLTGIGSVAKQTIDTLSKGFKRRVGLSQALIHDPDILILDEPTDGLDPNQKYEVRTLINKMARDKCIILSTHILEEVDEVCNRVAIIANGKLVADETPAKLKARSRAAGALSVSFEGNAPENVLTELAKISGVARVEEISKKKSNAVYLLYAQNNAVILPAVTEELTKRQWPYASVGLEQGYLDEVFRTLTNTGRN
ncbi:MAG: ATP-binding cassette domain-containing protein [Deltaproteobacteria bacterium]|nr:ATP-binding cassette domain-containing protein [Deltaproteobacteria bacterium]